MCITRKDDLPLRLPTNRGRETHLFASSAPPQRTPHPEVGQITQIHRRVYHRCFSTLACVCGGGFEVGFVSASSWLALVTGMGGYVLAWVEIGVLSRVFLYFCGC